MPAHLRKIWIELSRWVRSPIRWGWWEDAAMVENRLRLVERLKVAALVEDRLRLVERLKVAALVEDRLRLVERLKVAALVDKWRRTTPKSRNEAGRPRPPLPITNNF